MHSAECMRTQMVTGAAFARVKPAQKSQPSKHLRPLGDLAALAILPDAANIDTQAE